MAGIMDRLKELLANGKEEVKEAGPGQQGVIKQNLENGSNQTPEEKYEEIWKVSPKGTAAEKLFNPNKEEFNKVVNGMDFTKGIDPELMSKALQGDAASLASLLNRVGQSAFSTATMSNREMIEHANTQQSQNTQKMVQEQLRAMLAEQEAAKSNPAFSDPLVKPLLDEISGRLRAQFPEASSAELAKRAEKTLENMATKIIQSSPAERKKLEEHQMATTQQNEEQDWEAWGAMDQSQQMQPQSFES